MEKGIRRSPILWRSGADHKYQPRHGGIEINRPLVIAALILFFSQYSYAANVNVQVPEIALTDIPFAIVIKRANGGDGLQHETATIHIADEMVGPVAFVDNEINMPDLKINRSGMTPIVIEIDGRAPIVKEIRVIPGVLSILPAVLAILIALLFKTSIPSLFIAVWLGAWFLTDISMTGLFRAFLDAFQVHVLAAVINPDHAAVILFTSMIGGMVGIMSRNGGMRGIVDLIIRWANNRRKGQIAIWFLGLCVFIDDYTNVLMVGNSCKPLSDRLRISREKLAYIVDSTAAPISCIALVSTWIGYEVGLIADATAQFGNFGQPAYITFLNSIAYSFYPLLTIITVFAFAISGRDFGAMYHAERAALTAAEYPVPEALDADELKAEAEERNGKDRPRAINAVIPLTVLITAVMIGLYVTGEGDTLQEIFGSSDAYKSLMWGSLLAVITAAVMTIGQGIMALEQTVEAWSHGVKLMVTALIILILAWSLAEVTELLHTADYLVSWLGDKIPPALFPTFVFIIAAMTAFATGTSWGTMAILTPIFLPIVWAILQTQGAVDPAHYHIIYSTVACIMSGAVWGDHCSPISDTTILSSMASGCNHISHVVTQLPYALMAGTIAILFGTLPAGFGLPWWGGLLAGIAVLAITIRVIGKHPDTK